MAFERIPARITGLGRCQDNAAESRDQLLLQARQSMLSQANQVPQGVLQLMQ